MNALLVSLLSLFFVLNCENRVALAERSNIPDYPYSNSPYIIGPGDVLSINFLDPGAKEIGGKFSVLNDGSSSLSLIGSAYLSGLTLRQASIFLRNLYSEYLINPQLNLQVVNPRPIQVSIVGQVKKPGLYTLTTNEASLVDGNNSSQNGLPTVITALQKAGGLTLQANLKSVRLQRIIPGDKEQLFETELNFASLLKMGDKRQNPFLFDGDTIVVDKIKISDIGKDELELASSNLSPQEISVNVIGEVVNPGRITLPASTPMNQAILAAGGLQKWRGKRSGAELVRINRDGSASMQRVYIDYKNGINDKTNPALIDGDTIIVYRSQYGVAVDTLNAVGQPITSLVNILALSQLLAR